MAEQEMVINYVPGEECRVAIAEGGKLQELHAERMDGPSNHVGNIYVGKVVNVEPAIQAAFVDFGLAANGFLHVSDVHPQYFPGADADETERVGKKTPRRERPPIQDCFRRGDEVAVQVLKEGVGTKGPTVTSYLSIPGRFLVMMPQMDKVGVSRKVEDEETRRKMREILDQLELPEGFGFILRTAGMERSKAELKRDLAYLMRLWKDMEKRWRSGDKPRLLYSESDLLVRALRDLLTADIGQIVVDNEAALSRAARFLKIVAPRTSIKLAHYTGKSPIFHATGVEPQIQMIHAREVPLESGGRLVIDETEALVAIDVNSGKSRDARDSETNAYRTNCEAVDEICRQLRLRDIGGVIVSDLIDMRSAKHRRDIEQRMRDNLKKDRARWTIAPISEFGILEMTRQRMRASHESQHFADCPTCRGRGMVQRPDSVATDVIRDLAALVDHEHINRVEMVVHPRIAGELLSSKRRALSRVERTSGKTVDVRVSDAVAVDRVTFYAYDDRGDVDLTKLAQRRVRPDELVAYHIQADAASENWAEEPAAPADEHDYDDHHHDPHEIEPHPIELEPASLDSFVEPSHRGDERFAGEPAGEGADAGYAGAGEGQGGGRRRRRRRRGRGGRGGQGGPGGQGGQGGPYGSEQHPNHAQPDQAGYDQAGYDQGGYDQGGDAPGQYQPSEGDDGSYADAGRGGPGMNGQGGYAGAPGHEPGEGEGGRRRRRRRRRGRGRGRDMDGPGGFPADPGQSAPVGAEPSEFSGETGGYGPGEPMADGEGDPDGAYADPSGYAHDGQGMDGEPALGEGEYADAGDQGHAPQGGPGGPGGPGGDGTGRRRRRRRRGRRGGGGGGAAGGADMGMNEGERAGPGPRGPRPGPGPEPSLAAMFRGETLLPDDADAGSDEPEAPIADEGFDQGAEYAPVPDAEAADGEPASEPGRGPDGGDDRPRRGGRRRGGRGRGSRGGSGDRGPGPQESAMPQQPPEPSGSRGQNPGRPSPAPGKPAPGPAKPRTLYSSRRKLAPGEVKAPKREE